MSYVNVASDSSEVRAEVEAALHGDEFEVATVATGPALLRSVGERRPDLVVVDLQIDNMGGMAICLDLRLEASGGRLDPTPTLLLIDRRADVFMAKRSGAQGWIIKPTDPIRLRKAARAILSGETYHDPSFAPAVTATASG